MPNVQVGDLALVLDSTYEDNIGKVCTVVQRLPTLDRRHGGIWWFVRFNEPVSTRKGKQPFNVVQDKHLRLHHADFNVVRCALLKANSSRTLAEID